MRTETMGWVGHAGARGIVGRVPTNTNKYDHPTIASTDPNSVLYCGWDISLSRANSIFGKSSTVTPLSKSCKFFIRYI